MTRRIAAISDVHGDAEALAAVLQWLDDRGVSDVVCAGDIAGFGSCPNQCISMLVQRGVRAAMGNSDYSLLHPQSSTAPVSKRASEIAEIEAWVRGQLSRESLSYLRDLPHCLELEGGVLVVHGAPGDMARIVGPGDTPPIPCGIKVVMAGHLHVPFVIRHKVDFDSHVSARDIMASGMPFAGNLASAVLEARWYRSSSGSPDSGSAG